MSDPSETPEQLERRLARAWIRGLTREQLEAELAKLTKPRPLPAPPPPTKNARDMTDAEWRAELAKHGLR